MEQKTKRVARQAKLLLWHAVLGMQCKNGHGQNESGQLRTLLTLSISTEGGRTERYVAGFALVALKLSL